MSQQILNNMANARTKPTQEVVDALRRILGLPDDWPAANFRKVNGPGREVTLAGTPVHEIPTIGGGGKWDLDSDEGFALVPARMLDIGSVAFEVEGDAMMPMLQEGDIAVFKEFRTRLKGLSYLIKLPSGAYKVRELDFAGTSWSMVPTNRSYLPEPLPEGAEIVGLLVGSFRTRGTYEAMAIDPEGLRPF